MTETSTKKEKLIHAINWYPGHIAKAEKQLKEKISLIDFVIEVRDARIPFSSHHNQLRDWLGAKPYISILNKSDLADVKKAELAKTTIKNQGEAYSVVLVNSQAASLTNSLIKDINTLAELATKKFKDKGILKRPARIMVLGYPNVGKSTLINKLSKTKKAKVENRPGVTVRQQWIKVNTEQEILLLDTPGIIPTKLYSEDQAIKLALCNCVSAKAFDAYELLLHAIPFIDDLYPNLISNYYGVENYKSLGTSVDELLSDSSVSKFIETVALKKGWLQKGEADMERASLKIITDFREQKFGFLSLE